MTQGQQREAIRLLRVVAAASMGRTDFNPKQAEWIGWQPGEMEGVVHLRRDVLALLEALRSGDTRE